MIKLVAFDWNGTILSDTQATLKSENQVLNKLGLKTISLKRFQDTFSIPISDFLTANGYDKNKFKKQAKKILRYFHSAYDPLENNLRTRSGIKKTLYWLKQNQIQTVIYSNHTVSGIEKKLDRLGIKIYFDKILARTPQDFHIHMYQRNKENKLRLHTKSLKLKKDEVLTVGDTCEEIEIGKSLGYTTVALSGGFNSVSRLKTSKPDFLIHNMKDLIGIIRKLNSQG